MMADLTTTKTPPFAPAWTNNASDCTTACPSAKEQICGATWPWSYPREIIRFHPPPSRPIGPNPTFYPGRSCCPACCCPHPISHVVPDNWRQGRTSPRRGRLNRPPESSKSSVLHVTGMRLIAAGLLADAAPSTRQNLHPSGSGSKSPTESTGYLPMLFSGEYSASMVQSLRCGKSPIHNTSATVLPCGCPHKKLT